MSRVRSPFAPAQVALALAAVCAACARVESPVDLVARGERELARGDWEAARSTYEAAVSRTLRGERRHVAARLGVVQATLGLDAPRALDEFRSLAGRFPGRVGEPELVDVAGRMIGSGAWDEALELLDFGAATFGADSPHMGELRSFVLAERPRVYSLTPIDCWSDERK